jgi:hypothetical protein
LAASGPQVNGPEELLDGSAYAGISWPQPQPLPLGDGAVGDADGCGELLLAEARRLASCTEVGVGLWHVAVVRCIQLAAVGAVSLLFLRRQLSDAESPV